MVSTVSVHLQWTQTFAIHLCPDFLTFGRFFEGTNRRTAIKSWPRSQVGGHHPKPQPHISATQKTSTIPRDVNGTSQTTVQWRRTAAMTSLLRRRGKSDKIQLISYSKKNRGCGTGADCQQTFTRRAGRGLFLESSAHQAAVNVQDRMSQRLER